MSIVDKLTYLQTTKQLLKTEINKINNVLDDNSTFRSYPQELFNGYLDVLNNGTDTLWNNLEKVSQTGTEAVLEGVETAPMKMVLNGNTSQDGTPTPDTPVDIQVVKGENVVSVQSKNMANLSILGKVPSVSTGELVNYGDAGCTELIEIDNTQEYVFSFEMMTVYDKYVFFYDENKAYITNKGNPESGYKLNDAQVFSRTKYVRIRIDKMTNFKNIQLEQNSQATPYVPYSKTDYPINLGDIELCKINTYKDYFHKDSGKWYVHKEVGKVVLDGSENWNKTNLFYASVFVPRALATGGKISLYSPYFKYSVDARNNNSIFVPGTTNSYIWLNTDVATTVADFKTWLSTHNTIVYYVLATPTETEITNSTLIEQLEAIYKAKSVKDKTYITQTNDDLPFILDVEAIKEYSAE